MNCTAASSAPVARPVPDLIQRRLERALRERVRYRYVRPSVWREGDSYRIQSPCCSRSIDPGGGLIDIALLVPQENQRWSLCSRDHANNTWVPHLQNESLDTLLDHLCIDRERQFWP